LQYVSRKASRIPILIGLSARLRRGHHWQFLCRTAKLDISIRWTSQTCAAFGRPYGRNGQFSAAGFARFAIVNEFNGDI
jgi:hypothetical protein